MYTACPELLVYCKYGVTQWLLKLIVAYPTIGQLAKARAKSVAKIPYVTIERARELIDAARHSVASTTDSVTGQILQATAQEILRLNALIDEQVRLLVQSHNVPELELLKSFTGISDASAIGTS